MQKHVRRIEFKLTSLVLVIMVLGLMILPTKLQKNNITKLTKEQTTDEIKALEKEEISRSISVNELKEGDYIKYDTGVTSVGDNGVITCIVLYDSTSEYGVQIISEGLIDRVKLGDSKNFNNSANSYNNAITTLNQEANKYLNRNYATSARCVGSVPNNPNSETKTYYKTNQSWAKAISGFLKDSDNNYITDDNQMKKLGIKFIGESYWFASREVRSGAANLEDASVRYSQAVPNVYTHNGAGCGVWAPDTTHGNEKYSMDANHGFRPCFTLRSDLVFSVSGNGTIDNAYTVQTSYDVTIGRYDTETDKNGLPGSVIEMYDSQGNVIVDKNGNAVRLTTNGDGKINFKATPGTYYYKEVVAPTGHPINDTKYTFTVGEDGTVTFGNGTGNIYDKKLGFTTTIVDKDGKPVQGSKVELYDKDGNKVIGTDGKGTIVVTDSKGNATFTGVKPGSYGFKEIETADGKPVTNGTLHEVIIGTDGTVKFPGGSNVIVGGIQGGNQGGNQGGKPDETQTNTRLPQTGENKNIIIAAIAITIVGVYFGIKGIRMRNI